MNSGVGDPRGMRRHAIQLSRPAFNIHVALDLNIDISEFNSEPNEAPSGAIYHYNL